MDKDHASSEKQTWRGRESCRRNLRAWGAAVAEINGKNVQKSEKEKEGRKTGVGGIGHAQYDRRQGGSTIGTGSGRVTLTLTEKQEQCRCFVAVVAEGVGHQDKFVNKCKQHSWDIEKT